MIRLVLCFLTLFFIATQVHGQSEHLNSDSSRQLHNNTDSIVYVNFTVEPDGSIGKVLIEKIFCKGCSRKFKKSMKKEVLRSLRAMPNWKSAVKRAKFTLPVQFGKDCSESSELK